MPAASADFKRSRRNKKFWWDWESVFHSLISSFSVLLLTVSTVAKKQDRNLFSLVVCGWWSFDNYSAVFDSQQTFSRNFDSWSNIRHEESPSHQFQDLALKARPSAFFQSLKDCPSHRFERSDSHFGRYSCQSPIGKFQDLGAYSFFHSKIAPRTDVTEGEILTQNAIPVNVHRANLKIRRLQFAQRLLSFEDCPSQRLESLMIQALSRNPSN